MIRSQMLCLRKLLTCLVTRTVAFSLFALAIPGCIVADFTEFILYRRGWHKQAREAVSLMIRIGSIFLIVSLAALSNLPALQFSYGWVRAAISRLYGLAQNESQFQVEVECSGSDDILGLFLVANCLLFNFCHVCGQIVEKLVHALFSSFPDLSFVVILITVCM